LSVLVRYTDSDCPIGIFKLFVLPLGRCHCWWTICPRKCCSVSLKSKISCNWTEQGRIRKFETLSLVWWSEFRITELFVVSWEKGTHAVLDDTVSCLFLFDIRILIAPLVSSNFSYYLWVDVTAGGQFVPEDIIRPVASKCMNIRRSARILARTSPNIERWPKEKVQKDQQRSTKHTYKTKDPVTRTPLKTGDELVFRIPEQSSY
jgi:hypothetical protein